jgi:hypothetical protein
MEEMKYVYKILIGNQEGKRSLGRHSLVLQDKTKTTLNNVSDF